MFRFIELLGLVGLLWFIANFVHYIIWAASGFEGPKGFVFAMSSSWIKKAKEQKQTEDAKQTTTQRRKI